MRIEEDSPDAPRPIEGVGTAVAAFIGRVDHGPVGHAYIHSWGEFARRWADASPLGQAVEDFFRNGGSEAWIAAIEEVSPESVREAVDAMDPRAALVAIVDHAAAPPDAVAAAADALADRRAMLLVEAPWPDARAAIAATSADAKAALGATGPDVAVYWPRVRRPGSAGSVEEVSPLGGVAGVIARTDATRGVFRAPGGSAAVLRDVVEPSATLTRAEEEALTQLGVNVIRAFPRIGTVVWGARTQSIAGEWKYVPVRRTFLHIAESIERGLTWVVFEPNDEPLWRRARLSIETFLLELFREGAFAGATPEDAFFVKCDRSTMTQDDLDEGRLVCVVGFAPLKPAEFVVLTSRIADSGCRPVTLGTPVG